MEEDSQQGSNLLKRKFSEIDGDQNLSPMVTDSNGYLHLPLFVLDFGSYGFCFFQGFLVFFTKVDSFLLAVVMN